MSSLLEIFYFLNFLAVFILELLFDYSVKEEDDQYHVSPSTMVISSKKLSSHHSHRIIIMRQIRRKVQIKCNSIVVNAIIVFFFFTYLWSYDARKNMVDCNKENIKCLISCYDIINEMVAKNELIIYIIFN